MHSLCMVCVSNLYYRGLGILFSVTLLLCCSFSLGISGLHDIQLATSVMTCCGGITAIHSYERYSDGTYCRFMIDQGDLFATERAQPKPQEMKRNCTQRC